MDPHSKSNQVKHIPDGYHTVTPFLVVTQAALLIEFIKNAFRGEVVSQMDAPDGKIMHATMKIGDSLIMLSDANEKLPPMPCMLYLYVDEVDSFYDQAIKAKGISLRPPTDEFYGDRSAGIKDPWDNQWWIATHIEDLSEEEVMKRMEEFQSQQTTS